MDRKKLLTSAQLFKKASGYMLAASNASEKELKSSIKSKSSSKSRK
jgi:hypothetical protein